MNPVDSNKSSEFDLPRPSTEVLGTGKPLLEVSAPLQEKKAENQAIQAELPQFSPALPLTQTLQGVTVPQSLPPSPLQQLPQAVPQSTATGSPHIADDVDLIEKDWVVKAKAIVEHTKEDPHLQNKEINKFKADYIKKRYNKDVKLSNE